MKGIAIQTILLLLVGILVVGVIVFMVYRYFVGAPLSQEECRAQAITWCTNCRNAHPDWSCTTGPTGNCAVPVPASLADCAADYFPGYPTPFECNGAAAWCGAFITTA